MQSQVSQANLRGSLFMIGAMAGFAVEDAFLKGASRALPVGQILILFGLGGAAIFAVLARLAGQRLWTADALSRPMIVRVGFEIGGRLFYLLALALTPLSSATVILQAAPIVVVASAALLFGEKVGWRRWTAIFTGLLGVVVIVQPGTDSFSALSILAVLGMLGFSGRDLASRVAPRTIGSHVLGFYGFLAIIAAGVLYTFWSGEQLQRADSTSLAFLAAATVAGVSGYSCLMVAMRTGEVAAVTPFRYTRLLFGVALGVVFFGETLSVNMIAGSALIVTSGLFILWRGGRAVTD